MTSSVKSLPIKVVPRIPGCALSPLAPILPVKIISPSPAVLLIVNPPSSLVTPIEPVNVTSPAPELITKLSSSPPSVSNLAPTLAI